MILVRTSGGQERPATDVQAQFSVWVWNLTRIAFGQSAARAQKTQKKPTLNQKGKSPKLRLSDETRIQKRIKGIQEWVSSFRTHMQLKVRSAAAHSTHTIQLQPLISHSPSEIIQKAAVGGEKHHHLFVNISHNQRVTCEWRINGGIPGFEAPKLLSAISAPVTTHLSPSSLHPSFPL